MNRIRLSAKFTSTGTEPDARQARRGETKGQYELFRLSPHKSQPFAQARYLEKTSREAERESSGFILNILCRGGSSDMIKQRVRSHT